MLDVLQQVNPHLRILSEKDEGGELPRRPLVKG
jgi:hypothetical protein